MENGKESEKVMFENCIHVAEEGKQINMTQNDYEMDEKR